MTERSEAPFRVVSYPSETLPNQPEALTTFGDLLMLSAHESMPDEIVEEFVRVFVEHGDQIKKYHGFLKPRINEIMAFMAAENPDLFHPGSIKRSRTSV